MSGRELRGRDPGPQVFGDTSLSASGSPNWLQEERVRRGRREEEREKRGGGERKDTTGEMQ